MKLKSNQGEDKHVGDLGMPSRFTLFRKENRMIQCNKLQCKINLNGMVHLKTIISDMGWVGSIRHLTLMNHDFIKCIPKPP